MLMAMFKKVIFKGKEFLLTKIVRYDRSNIIKGSGFLLSHVMMMLVCWYLPEQYFNKNK